MELGSQIIACSLCFTDRGLKLDAEQLGIMDATACPHCKDSNGHKLTIANLEDLAHRFFVWGSLSKCEYGAAPLIQFNQHQNTSINVSPWLKKDLELFERILGVGFFHYGPRLWMVGEVEPLKSLQSKRERLPILDRIVSEYPEKIIGPNESFYRVRKNPQKPSVPLEYDSPPEHLTGKERMDMKDAPVLYASPDLQICLHECKVSAGDDLYVATLRPQRSLKLLDLTVLPREENITEFESLDMAVHMVFLADKHSYKITRTIATAARSAGFDGLVYPSYFSLLRLGTMPFQTVYGISHRRIPEYQKYEQAKAMQNLAIFGRPIDQGNIAVECINKLIIHRVEYGFHFGPVDI